MMKKLALSLVALAVITLASAPAAQAAADGKALYDAKWQEATKLEAIETAITDGKGKMKGYKDKMSAEEIKAVAGYVKTIK